MSRASRGALVTVLLNNSYLFYYLSRHRKLPTNKMMGVDSQNELVMRVQPDEVSECVGCKK